MRALLCSWMIGVGVLLACPAPAAAQAPPQPVEAKPSVRDDSKATISYALTILVVAVIMLLVCMPARRE